MVEIAPNKKQMGHRILWSHLDSVGQTAIPFV